MDLTPTINILLPMLTNVYSTFGQYPNTYDLKLLFLFPFFTFISKILNIFSGYIQFV